ncbi:uncharacterized protein LOC124943170 [Impatiens glandulifera]|uniref:uncharacterized protein LOC124943170 n=1 Tax=Impatiens glandulifera TaxID=253017 RepID=UPI001FB066A7|nr:uncharacterized protein LOC124943170 [Impatiens glandulifera]
MERPTEIHLNAAKKVIRYIKGTLDLGILYNRGNEGNLVGFTDSDYAGDLDDRRSTSGYVFKLGKGAVAWASKKQPIVTLSTIEAEFVAAALCACQAVWMKRLLKTLFYSHNECITLFCDNSSTIKLAKMQCYMVETADIMTKALKLESFEKLRVKLGICRMQKGNILRWCIADEQMPDDVLRRALNWACSHGADCRKIQPKQACFWPNTVKAHASYAFNSYYQRQKHKHNSCHFKSAAFVTEINPKGNILRWCIADEQMPDDVLQRALDWACSHGADCRKIQPKQPCFWPNTVKAHASYAFNSYYQRQKHKHNSCHFKSAAFVTEVNPSHGSCRFEVIP